MYKSVVVGVGCGKVENMTRNKSITAEFRLQLEKLCNASGSGYCPGCGLTTEGLDKLLESAYDLGVKHTREHSKESQNHKCVDCGIDVEKYIAQCDGCRREI